MHTLQNIIEANWSRISKGPKPARLAFIVLYRTFLVFKDNQRTPFMVIKYSHDNSLEHEFDNLRRINKLLPNETPEPYFYDTLGHYHLLGERFKHGTKVTNLSLTKGLLQNIFHTLIRFHKASYQGNFSLDNEHMDEMVIKPFSQFLKINPSKFLQSELSQLLDTITGIKACHLPWIPQHCDFCLLNILFDDITNKVYIIDWADFGKTYLPLYDAFLLIINYYCRPEKFSLFLEDNVINKNLVKSLTLYLQHFKIDKRWVRTLFFISLITFFNQNYPDRKEALGHFKEFIIFCFKNKDKIFFNKILQSI